MVTSLPTPSQENLPNKIMKAEKMQWPYLKLELKDCFSCPGLVFCFHMKLKIILSISVNSCVGILIVIALNL